MKENDLEMEANFSFSENALFVAEQLQGATVHTDSGDIQIVFAQGYEKASIKINIFQGAIKEDPGTLTATPYRASLLPNITVGEEGLVMIRAISRKGADGNSELIIGPGRVAKALHLEKGDKRTLGIEDSQKKIFRIENRHASTDEQENIS